MKKHGLAAAIAFAFTLTGGAAWASSCPSVAKQIEAALVDTKVTPEVKAQAEAMLSAGKELHATGDHTKSMEVLSEAKVLLGLE